MFQLSSAMILILKVLIKNLHEDIFHLWEHHPQVRGHKKHIEDMAEVEKFLEETK